MRNMTPEPDAGLDDSDTSDWGLTNKLRIEDPEQFHTLVRMHLSFVLDLNTDETDCSIEEKSKFRPLKWSFNSFSKKLKNTKNLGEGENLPLNQDILSQIYQLIEFLSFEENIVQEGIFRKSGSTSRQQELKNLLGQGNAIDLSRGPFSVHDCASVLKCYLAELPEPVLLELYYPAYCQIADSSEETTSRPRLLRCIQLLLLLLPMPSYSLFHKLIQLLHLTASHASQNLMSSNNLATLFTPHLLCPRKLSPETLHSSAAVLSKILVFMIDHGDDIFLVPDTLATDVKAYWAKKERRLKSPVKDPVNESLMDSSAVNTVFTFVDREKTAQENTENATEAALAQLYAYIQALPESSKKRRLVKQFNKENGHGTPAVVARLTPGPNHHSSGKHFSDSIKKHIFSKGIRSRLNYQTSGKHKTKLTLDNVGTGGNECHRPRSTGDLIPPSLRQTPTPGGSRAAHGPSRIIPDLSRLYAAGDAWAESSDDEDLGSPFFATPSQRLVVSRRPAVGGWSGSPLGGTNCTPSRESLSPITMSAQKMSRAMQETMLTPRSRKPVVALSGTNLCTLATFQSPLPLPSCNDDLLTATVDLSFTHDSLSDSMIKSLDEESEGLLEKDDGQGVKDTHDEAVNAQTEDSDAMDLRDPKMTILGEGESCFSGMRDMEDESRREDTRSGYGRQNDTDDEWDRQLDRWDGGVTKSHLDPHSENTICPPWSSLRQPERSIGHEPHTTETKDKTSPPFILNRVKTSASNLFARKLGALELSAENQNPLHGKQSGSNLASRHQKPLQMRDNFHTGNRVKGDAHAQLRKENSLGSAFENRLPNNPLLRKENSSSVFETLQENRRESDSSTPQIRLESDSDIHRSPASTPPSRKRNSQNNNNDEGEVKRFLRESSAVFPLSETAL